MTPTPSPQTLPEHGTRSRYSNHRCRCGACRRSHRDYERARARRKAYGTWQPYIDAEPVRAHVRGLMAQGLGWRRIADVAGLSRATMNKLLYGAPSNRRSPAARVRQATADRLLAVRFDPALFADSALVDATGTWRRVRALVAVGWPKVHIARALGAKGEGLQLHDTQVLASTARKVSDLYDAWWNADPTRHGVSAGQVARARRHARDHGWPPPMAWDDDALDDPEAQSHTDSTAHPERGSAAAERLEDITHLAAAGADVHETAQRLGITTHYVRHLAARHTSTPGPEGGR